MSRFNADEQFGMDSDPITRELMLQALQLAESMAESEGSPETLAALELLQIEKTHLSGLMKRIKAGGDKERMKLTLGDHLLLYTCFYLFTKFYSEELTDRMLESMDDMDRMHLDEPEILQLRFYREEMTNMMNLAKERFSSFPLFTRHLETLEVSFPVITGINNL
jgi:hypothetical protein